MALTSAPSGISENPETKELTNEAQKRVDTVAKNAVAVLDKNLDAQSAISKLFGEMVSNNLRDPKNIAKIQDGLYGARDERLSQASPTERLDILESFSTFMAKFTQGIAQMNRDIVLSNDANRLAYASDIKMNQVKSTYAKIISDNHPTLTA